MDLQDPRFTIPLPDYGNLYNIEPHYLRSLALLLSLPDSQKTIQLWDSYNGPRPQIDKLQPI